MQSLTMLLSTSLRIGQQNYENNGQSSFDMQNKGNNSDFVKNLTNINSEDSGDKTSKFLLVDKLDNKKTSERIDLLRSECFNRQKNMKFFRMAEFQNL